eukprot:4870039-Amphidinium_carterae.1
MIVDTARHIKESLRLSRKASFVKLRSLKLRRDALYVLLIYLEAGHHVQSKDMAICETIDQQAIVQSWVVWYESLVVSVERELPPPNHVTSCAGERAVRQAHIVEFEKQHAKIHEGQRQSAGSHGNGNKSNCVDADFRCSRSSVSG